MLCGSNLQKSRRKALSCVGRGSQRRDTEQNEFRGRKDRAFRGALAASEGHCVDQLVSKRNSQQGLTEEETETDMTQEEIHNENLSSTTQEEQKPEEGVPVTKWRGGIKMVINCSIQRAWDVSAEFCGLHKWVDTTDTCECIEGEPQKPGCVRVMTGKSFPRADGSKSYAKEKLLTFDNESRSMSYLMMDNNFGLSDYIATYKMQDLGDGAVLVDWSFEVNPIPGSTEQKTADYMTGTYKQVLKKLEALINSQTSSETSHATSESADSLKAAS